MLLTMGMMLLEAMRYALTHNHQFLVHKFFDAQIT